MHRLLFAACTYSVQGLPHQRVVGAVVQFQKGELPSVIRFVFEIDWSPLIAWMMH